MSKQIITKKRVRDHGEVFTNPREVNAMLDLVKTETERMDSRFLEPACGKPFISEPNSCSTATYMVMSVFDSVDECKHFISYVNTKFFRFLVLLKKSTQHASREVYSFVPVQDFSEPWTDEKLYKKYGLTQEEIDFIESMIKPME